ncbi:DHHC palmitoyltransferase-domain-containing protein [Ilyonectria robusta]|uniref:DHHC palmitoyltransferase-domain-containing protein n=1 Tax=Ilyonectria robusta TaxID=1079257 RepID=UPI001E8CA0DF|nr:DHHC palmitoyltransferase-domain-containing protein [Ilyonectria robusta]KAH8677196.1 DHHC palmitoyltransferase-domain-containing protein [Ilyonectria robusta]
MPRPVTSNRAETRWTVRIIPFFIAAAFGFATFVVVPHLCINYLYRQEHKTGIAITLIVLWFVFFILTIAAYLRTFFTVQFNPGLVPLSAERQAIEKGRKNKRYRGGDIETHPWVPPDSNPDSPGLEAFYSKDVFVCELDGRPKWCSDCQTWKPDRAHHSSEIDRCIRKMDHLCPWVGGVVSETSFNFFAQFTFYCSICCIICIATAAYSLRLQQNEDRPLDGRIVAGIALGSLFALFTIAMTLTSARFIATNITNIDMLKKSQSFRLAVRVPQNSPSTQRYQTITYPLASPAWGQSGVPMNHIPRISMGTMSPASPRDEQAKRTFAILATEPGENPWDTGVWKNCKSVMGNSILEWLLPIWHSPCCNHDSMESDYEFGPVVEKLKKRYGIPDSGTPAADGIEMRSAGASRH